MRGLVAALGLGPSLGRAQAAVLSQFGLWLRSRLWSRFEPPRVHSRFILCCPLHYCT
eukprot:COSAG04_NODE_3199_length_3058_cov_3.081784_2_plen_57_part_00